MKTSIDYLDYLSKETFVYIIIKENGQLNKNILRIDLFRQLTIQDGRKWFEGGLLHTFKHSELVNVDDII